MEHSEAVKHSQVTDIIYIYIYTTADFPTAFNPLDEFIPVSNSKISLFSFKIYF